MTDYKEKELVASRVYRSYIKWRNGFVVKLALFHFALVFIFDVLSVYFPSVMTAAAWKGSAFTIGVVYACGIVLSVILSTFYYSYRINQETVFITESPEHLDGKSR